MKIEKINDSQIRCILTKSELEKRDLKLSEISYGSAKVKKLFQDMMLLADVQCGFKADDLPLAIEVTPFRDYAAITVTKVEDPEELDTRYSRFAPGVDNQGGVLSELDKSRQRFLIESMRDVQVFISTTSIEEDVLALLPPGNQYVISAGSVKLLT